MDKHQVSAQQPSQTRSSQSVEPLQDHKMPPSLPNDRHRDRESNFMGVAYPTDAEIFEMRSHALMPLLGYGLLLFSLFDYAAIIYPPRFTDPAWELQTIGQLVEHVAIPLLGLLFVFYRDYGRVAELEKNFLPYLSWLCLLCGLLYLLMLPLGAADTWRLYQANKVQVSARVSLQHKQFQRAKGQLNRAKTDEQIRQVVTSLTPDVRPKDLQNPQAFKEQFLNQISKGEREVEIQANKVWTDQSQTLLKNSIKWNLGALVSGTLFVLIWRLTNWARNKDY